MKKTQFLKLSKHLATKTIAEGVIATPLDVQASEIFEVTDVGLTIWNLLKDGMTLETLISHLSEEYESFGSKEEAEVFTFIDLMVQKKLVVLG
jgi:hypothetical protein